MFPNLNMVIDPLISPPTQEQAKLLRQIILSGMVDKIAKYLKFYFIQININYSSIFLI